MNIIKLSAKIVSILLVSIAAFLATFQTTQTIVESTFVHETINTPIDFNTLNCINTPSKEWKFQCLK